MSPAGMLAVYLGVAAVIVTAFTLLAGRLAPLDRTAVKRLPYECGVSEVLSTQHRWPVRFALVAMLFLVFDVESLFFYPWAVQIRELGVNGLLAMGSFFVVLGGGYIYARGRHALQWKMRT